ncbi:MAG: hypothetical protein M0Z55_06590 [Peptococcaceae bacterium]|nr:hypothetical protein [Peptococcaceae bacterium]
MTGTEKEVLDFLRDFEISSRTYFLGKGVTNSELPEVLLEAQWQLLRNILQSKLGPPPRQKNYRHNSRRKSL